jgi:repressor of nif and glnA expression
MVGQEVGDVEGKLIAILEEISRSSEPIGSTIITRRLKRGGIFLSERGVRSHLKIADARGYTQPFGREGRMITAEGRQEIREAMAERRLGFVLNKLKMLAYQTTFDPEKRSGQIPINISLINQDSFKKAILAMKGAFKAGICVSDLVAIASEGEILGSVVIPSRKIGLATVCSVAVNGLLLKVGVPTEYRFGGILEIRSSQPSRFTAIINYVGTSLDPSEEFLRSGMTSVVQASRTGNGKVLGVFRTIPALARNIVQEKLTALKEAGIGGIYAIGNNSRSLCQITVALNRSGIIQLSGLNPVAAAVEVGIETENIAGSGLIDFQQLQPVWKL